FGVPRFASPLVPGFARVNGDDWRRLVEADRGRLARRLFVRPRAEPDWHRGTEQPSTKILRPVLGAEPRPLEPEWRPQPVFRGSDPFDDRRRHAGTIAPKRELVPHLSAHVLPETVRQR